MKMSGRGKNYNRCRYGVGSRDCPGRFRRGLAELGFPDGYLGVKRTFVHTEGLHVLHMWLVTRKV